MTQQDWQAQAKSKAREVGQKVHDIAKSEQVKQATEKVKTRWRGLSGRNKAIVVCVGVLGLFLSWRLIIGGGKSWTPDTLLSLVEEDAKAAEKELESTWITVTGTVDRAAYLRDGGLLIPRNTSAIALSSRSRDFKVEAFFEGPESGGVETDSLSRGDMVTVKGKVSAVSGEVVGLEQCQIASVQRR